MKTRWSLTGWIAVTFAILATETLRADDGIFAEVQTTLGSFTIALEFERAPLTVANIIGLIEGSNPWVDPRNGRVVTNRYYDGIRFHRVISNFMIQAGSPQATGSDGPGYTFPDEFHPSLSHDAPGTVSMANTGPHSNGGQFFVTVTNTPWLDGVHTIFGRVISGMETVHAIATVPATNNRPLTDIIITNVLVTRVGQAAEAFSVAHPRLPTVEATDLVPMLTATGMAVVTELTPQQHVVTVWSTNLISWNRLHDHYKTSGDGSWTSSVPASALGFITGHRITYTADTNVVTTIAGHEIFISFPINRFHVIPREPLSGTIQLNTNIISSLTYWEWARRPWQASLLCISLGYVPLRFDLYFDTPDRGRSKGYLYNGIGWLPIDNGAIGTFSNRWASP